MLVDYVHVYSNDPSVRTATPESGYVPGGDGTALIDQSNQSEIDLMGLATADGYSYKNDMLDVLSGSKIIDTLRLTDQTPNGFVVEPPTSGGSVNIVAISDPLHPPPSLPNLTGLV